MGKVLIAYASKSGTAKEAAERLAGLLPGADMVDLSIATPALEDYDAVIVGGGVRVGSVHKDTKRFIDTQGAKLEGLRCAYFITNCFIDEIDTIVDKMLPANLKAKAVFAGSLGGRLDIENLKGLDKAVAKMVSKTVDEGKPVASDLDEEAIKLVARRLLV
jgi:menaquinone-dependent protoporphyrinogen IX oxidase